MSTETQKLDQAEKLLGDLEKVESQLSQLRAGLTRSHRLSMLGTMTTFLAHEFNNVLTPVVSYCQLAQQAPDDVALQHKAVAKALDAAMKAAQINSSMLGFALGHDSARQADVGHVISEAFNCMARDPKKDGVEVVVEVAPGCTAGIPPISLQQVLLNLLLNARQVLRKKGGRIWIRAASEGGRTKFEVADNGPGIPPEIIETLFEPFVTSRPDEIGQPKGTGLGLAICRDLIVQAGGTIRVESEPGRGAVFHIDLPERAG